MRRHCPARSFLPTSPQVWSIVCHSGKRWKFCYEPETQCEQNLYHVASELSWPLKRDIFRHTYFVLNLIVWIKRNVSNNGICALSKIKSPNIMVFKRILGSIVINTRDRRAKRSRQLIFFHWCNILWTLFRIHQKYEPILSDQPTCWAFKFLKTLTKYQACQNTPRI